MASIRPANAIRMCSIQFKAWSKHIAEELGADIKRSSDAMGLMTSGIIRLPTARRRWSVRRSPFVHSKSHLQVPADAPHMGTATQPRACTQPPPPGQTTAPTRATNFF